MTVELESLELWIDTTPRSGPENMAVDEWLWESIQKPTLRVYKWTDGWGSFGYFTSAHEAQSLIPSLNWVRRHTGGGIVDHRNDWTYTLLIPKEDPTSSINSSLLYGVIHDALARAIQSEGQMTNRVEVDHEVDSNLCFEKPVSQDLINAAGQKIAGAGQRRGKHGIMHQGSLALPVNEEDFTARAIRLANELSKAVQQIRPEVPAEIITAKVASRYGTEQWTLKRP